VLEELLACFFYDLRSTPRTYSTLDSPCQFEHRTAFRLLPPQSTFFYFPFPTRLCPSLQTEELAFFLFKTSFQMFANPAPGNSHLLKLFPPPRGSPVEVMRSTTFLFPQSPSSYAVLLLEKPGRPNPLPFSTNSRSQLVTLSCFSLPLRSFLRTAEVCS